MSRKSIKGYAEKNYYDNTRFNGGILTSGDPLNEGYFNHLVNFDITDTGQSLVPRKGLFTTTFKYEDNILTFNKKSTIYFFDANIGKYIFIDFSQIYNSAYLYAFKIDMSIDVSTNYIDGTSLIQNIDYSDLPADVYDKLYNIKLYKNIAYPIIDENGITKYVVKVELQTSKGYEPYWLTFNYREKKNTQYPTDDTLIISYLNTDNEVTYLESKDRNIASKEPWVPASMQNHYSIGNIPDGHINTLNKLYTVQDGKYLINEIKSSHDQGLPELRIIPNFNIADTDDNYEWMYTYDITSTAKTNYWTNEPYIHRGAMYRVSDNTQADITYFEDSFLDSYEKAYDKKSEKYKNFNIIKYEKTKAYEKFMQSLTLTNLGISTYKDKYLLYAVPDPDGLSDIDLNIDSINSSTLGNYLFDFDSTIRALFGTVTITLPEAPAEGEDYWKNVRSKVDTRNKLLEENKSIFCNDNTKYIDYSGGRIDDSIHSTLLYLNSLGFKFYKIKVDDLVDYFSDSNLGFHRYMQTSFNNKAFAIPKDSKLLSAEDIIYSMQATDSYLLKIYSTASSIKLSSVYNNEHVLNDQKDFIKFFPNVRKNTDYYIYTDRYTSKPSLTNLDLSEESVSGSLDADVRVQLRMFESNDMYNSMFKFNLTYFSDVPIMYDGSLLPLLPISSTYIYLRQLKQDYVYIEEKSLFSRESKEEPLIAHFSDTNTTYKYLKNKGFFSQGLILTFYLMYIPKEEYYTNNFLFDFKYEREVFINHAYIQSCQLVTVESEPTTIVVTLEDEPKDIAYPKDYLVFNSSLGDHLVVYTGNKVYISKESIPYYFRYDYVHDFPETIIKVIQYKDMLLVFTKHDLYSIYIYETVNLVENGLDSEGNPSHVQQTVYNFAKLPVLYNLMVDEKYKDAIQVYNQMILFYSSDGQLFLIKPTAAIDNDTRFSLQFINKAANDILLNYKQYMKKRLEQYMMEHENCSTQEIQDVEIKVQVSINYIKIYYIAPNIMTYILIYDILNNRYTVYDTLSINNINYLSNDFSITEYRDKLYVTQFYVVPYQENNNVDMAIYNNFNPESINCEIDTGVLNLNNHLKKRFKDLRIFYKNISANDVLFNSEVFLDDVPIKIQIEPTLEVRDISNTNNLIVLDEINTQNLLDQNTALFNFLDYSSNKIITQKNNIVCKGKTIRFILYFDSKGKYKVQGYGIIYKEHTV